MWHDERITNIYWGFMYEIYGVAYNSTLILQQLISVRRYNPIALHATYSSQHQIKAEVEKRLKENHNMPVVLAGNLHLARSFFKLYPHHKVKLVLCECPPFLNPPCSEVLQWLDCDLQAAGAWQVAKIKPEDFMDLLDTLQPFGDAGRRYLASVRYIDDDEQRLDTLYRFSESIPKYYKDTISSLDPANNKSPIKTLKDTRKNKENLKSLLMSTLDCVSRKHKRELAKLVLDYQLSLVSKREYLSVITKLLDDETQRKEFMTLRKWMDSKAGMLLKEAFYDYAANYQKATLTHILERNKRIAEEDLQMLVSHFDVRNALQAFPSKVASYHLNNTAEKECANVGSVAPGVSLDELLDL